MKINIKGTEIELKNTFRSMIIYENIMDKTFVPSGVTEIIVYFYCVVIASKKDIELQYEEFLDFLDDNPDYLNQFSKWICKVGDQNNHIKKNSQGEGEESQ